MDSVGCGGAPDAADFGDAGANTLGHIALACAEGRADQGRSGPLHLPNLDALGLGAAMELASGLKPPGLGTPGLGTQPKGRWGAGSVQLVEIPTVDETFDNIVAFWHPAQPVQPGEELLVGYRLFWGSQ
eukprot:gene21755-26668_t